VNKKIFQILISIIFLTSCTSAPVETAVEIPAEVVTTEASNLIAPTQIEEVATPQAQTATAVPVRVEEIIEMEMERSFNFFWEQTNTDIDSQGYGLIRDRYPGSQGIASIASVGFGLTAYLIGIEKGYVSYDEVYERVNRTFDTLLGMDREEGFYYHFVNMDDGKRAWSSEVSSIDTAILMMGVLSAGEYFGGEIQSKANMIYEGINWLWFLDESKDMFYMAYRPGEGFSGHWDFYAEQLMLYVLAAGSDTYPVDETPYYSFTRHYGRFQNGDKFIHSWFGSIFTYQYSHAWIDFRDYLDKKDVNWFDNSVHASLAHYNYAVFMEDKFETLGRYAWGLTACDGPDGYNGLYGAPPSGYDNNAHVVDDTISPSGAIGSVLFLPDEAKAAIVNYFSYEDLWGEYGFLDAYNLSQDWFGSDVIGISKGVSLLMLANYQANHVYKIVMPNEHIQNGLERLQITKNN
jgi:hypothetical protein